MYIIVSLNRCLLVASNHVNWRKPSFTGFVLLVKKSLLCTQNMSIGGLLPSLSTFDAM